MARLICKIPGKELDGVKEDFRAARRVEQYRLGNLALYLPRGLSWEYIPLAEIRSGEKTRRVISAGHCVTVREEKPAVDLVTDAGSLTLNLEKPSSLPLILDALQTRKQEGRDEA